MRICTWFIASLRSVIRTLQTSAPHFGPIAKLLRSVAMLPFFGCLLILVRLRARLLGPLRIETTTTSGHRVACHLPDLIQMYLYVFGIWEPDLAAYIQRRLRPGDVFIDIGANIGFDSLLAAQAVGDAGRVVAIEASPLVYERLRETIRLNGNPTNVRMINAAASDRPGTLEVFAGPAHNTGLTTTVQRGAMPRVASIEAAPLANLLEPEELRRARLIKIDVEGGEPAVLAGIAACLDDLPSNVEIAVELSPLWWSDRSRTAAEVLKPFTDHGFIIHTIPNNYWPWRYLWPACVAGPAQLRDESLLTRPIKRLDVVLARGILDRS